MIGGPEFIILIVWLIPVAAVWLLLRRPSDRSVAAFAKTYVVPLTPHNVGQLRRYIAWTRRWRLGGAVVALTVAGALTMVRGESTGVSWLPIVVGYSLGSLVGEIVRPVEPRDGRQLATLERRTIVDFVTPGVLVILVVGGAAVLASVGWLLATNPMRGWSKPTAIGEPYRPQDWYVITLAAIALICLAIVWLGGRALARAPMPADSPDRQAVRHAIRSAAMLSLMGGAALGIGATAAKLANIVDLLASPRSLMSQVAPVISVLGLLMATFGGLMTLTSIPRLALFSGRLPPVPEAESTARI